MKNEVINTQSMDKFKSPMLHYEIIFQTIFNQLRQSHQTPPMNPRKIGGEQQPQGWKYLDSL
jgi:hypothetical protein